MENIYASMADTALTDQQRESKSKEMDALQDKMMEVAKAGISQNITNAVGVHLLKSNYYYLDVKELDPLVSQIPATYSNDATVIRIKENVEKMKATAVGKKFTDFEMQTPEGKTVKLSDYVGKGKTVLVDFWASWCGPCRREMPNLVEAYAKYKNKNFEIVGVSLDQSADSWKEAIKKLNITWPQMSDLKYWNCEGAKLYAVSSIPHTVLIDGDGIILARGLHGEELQEKGWLKFSNKNKADKNINKAPCIDFFTMQGFALATTQVNTSNPTCVLRDGNMRAQTRVQAKNMRAAISLASSTVFHCFTSSSSEELRRLSASGRQSVKCFTGI